MAEPLQLPREPLRAWARLHTNQSGFRAFEKCQERFTPELHALNDAARVVGADHVEEVLPQIDSVNAGTRLVANHLSSSCCGAPDWGGRTGRTISLSLHASEQDRPEVARRRAQWRKYQGRLDPSRLVFIDETWAKTNMTRTHGRAPRGERLVAKAPHGRWRTLTFLAALRYDRLDAPCVIGGPINGESFLAYVEQILVPALKPGDIVILDNLGSHKGKAVRRAIRAAGAKLFFLPPYSRTSIRSSSSSPNSKPCCARPPNEPSKPHGDGSEPCSKPSAPPSAPTTSSMPDTLQNKTTVL